MNEQQILDNAPEGAKGYGLIQNKGDTPFYCDGIDLAVSIILWLENDGGFWEEYDVDTVCIYGLSEFRSLSDIKRIAQLEKMIDRCVFGVRLGFEDLERDL